MKARVLGRTGLEVSEIGFGCWGIGGDAHGNSLGPTDDAVSKAAIEKALEGGVTFFDTADIYGHGHSESLLGEALASIGARKKAVIATKAGADFTDPRSIVKRFEPEYLRSALQRSLERLRTDHVDIFQLHDPPVAALRSPEVHEALANLKREGLARFVGASIHTPEEGSAVLESPIYDAIQIVVNAGSQRMLIHIVAAAKEKGLGIIAREPLASGLLTGKYTVDHAFSPGDFRARLPSQHKEYMVGLARRMDTYFHSRARVEKSLAAISTQFVLADSRISTVLVGIKTPAQASENVAISELPPLSAMQLSWLRE